MTGSGVRLCHSLKSVSKSDEVENEGSLDKNERRSVTTHVNRHCITLQQNDKICHASKTYNRMTSLVSEAIGFLHQDVV